MILYSIRFSDPMKVYRPIRAATLAAASARGKDGLARMAKETGGVMFEVSKQETIETIHTQIEEVLRNQYNIGYGPERRGSIGEYHKIKLTAKDRTLSLHTREGYYAR